MLTSTTIWMSFKNIILNNNKKKQIYKNESREHTVCFPLYEVLEWTKLIYDDRNQKTVASVSREAEINWKGL